MTSLRFVSFFTCFMLFVREKLYKALFPMSVCTELPLLLMEVSCAHGIVELVQ